MKTLLVILSLAAFVHADGAHGHGDHHANHQPAAPAAGYSQPPAPAAPAPTYSKPAPAPAAPTYQQPPAAAAPVDNGYYYYYYPVEPVKKEKDFFGKVKEEFDSLKLKASKFELGKPDTKTIIIIALVVVGLIVLLPTIGSLLGLGTFITTITTWINTLIANIPKTGRDVEVNLDDVMRYASVVYKAINKKY